MIWEYSRDGGPWNPFNGKDDTDKTLNKSLTEEFGNRVRAGLKSVTMEYPEGIYTYRPIKGSY